MENAPTHEKAPTTPGQVYGYRVEVTIISTSVRDGGDSGDHTEHDIEEYPVRSEGSGERGHSLPYQIIERHLHASLLEHSSVPSHPKSEVKIAGGVESVQDAHRTVKRSRQVVRKSVQASSVTRRGRPREMMSFDGTRDRRLYFPRNSLAPH